MVSVRMMRARSLVPTSVINGILFNITWLCIVVSESAVFAPLFALLHLTIHFTVVGARRYEIKLVALVTGLGFLLDQLLFKIGVFTVAGAASSAPLWMTSLWPVLATTVLHAFSFLQGRLWLAVVFGAVGGALSYTAGTSLTAVEFFDPSLGPLVLGLVWALVFPLLLALGAYFARRVNSPEG